MAAALAFASAAVTLFWTLGGTLGLDTVGGQLEELARARSAGALLLGTVVVLARSPPACSPRSAPAGARGSPSMAACS
ncbi:MAG: hypothetical protein M3550_15700 [Actinomycetota bacterium]|nr:hypothetical protein [Actinomycetota bacterium]